MAKRKNQNGAGKTSPVKSETPTEKVEEIPQSKFVIVGIEKPGRIHVYKRGVVELYNCTDDELEILMNEGVDHIQKAITNKVMPKK